MLAFFSKNEEQKNPNKTKTRFPGIWLAGWYSTSLSTHYSNESSRINEHEHVAENCRYTSLLYRRVLPTLTHFPFWCDLCCLVGVAGATAVGLGAIGAHALPKHKEEVYREVWKTAFFVLNPICLDFTTANVNLTVSRHHLEACVLSAGGWRLHFCNRMTQSILHDTLPILLRVLGYLIKISTLRSKSSTTRRILYDGDGLPCRTVSLGTVDTSNTNNNITLQSSLLSGYSR